MKLIKILGVVILLVLIFGKPIAWVQPMPIEEWPEEERVRYIRDKYVFYELYAAYALSNEDLSICQKSIDPQACIEHAEYLSTIYNFAKGDCDQLKSEAKRELCKGLNSGCRTIDNDCLKQMCDAIKNKDIQKVVKVSGVPYWAFNLGIIGQEGAADLLAVYYGAKSNRISTCLKYQDPNNLVRKAVCRILFSSSFSSSDFSELVDDLIQQYTKKEGF